MNIHSAFFQSALTFGQILTYLFVCMFTKGVYYFTKRVATGVSLITLPCWLIFPYTIWSRSLFFLLVVFINGRWVMYTCTYAFPPGFAAQRHEEYLIPASWVSILIIYKMYKQSKERCFCIFVKQMHREGRIFLQFVLVCVLSRKATKRKCHWDFFRCMARQILNIFNHTVTPIL